MLFIPVIEASTWDLENELHNTNKHIIGGIAKKYIQKNLISAQKNRYTEQTKVMTDLKWVCETWLLCQSGSFNYTHLTHSL